MSEWANAAHALRDRTCPPSRQYRVTLYRYASNTGSSDETGIRFAAWQLSQATANNCAPPWVHTDGTCKRWSALSRLASSPPSPPENSSTRYPLSTHEHFAPLTACSLRGFLRRAQTLAAEQTSDQRHQLNCGTGSIHGTVKRGNVAKLQRPKKTPEHNRRVPPRRNCEYDNQALRCFAYERTKNPSPMS